MKQILIRPVLVPAPGSKERARYESLVSFIMTELDSQALWIHRKHSDLANVFGEAPVAVKEARRQFGNSLQILEDELHLNSEGDCCYLLPSGFSAADILLADCCSWAKHIGWLVKKDERNVDEEVRSALKFPNMEDEEDEQSHVIEPVVMSIKLENYVTMCRSRTGHAEANQLRKDQTKKGQLSDEIAKGLTAPTHKSKI
jgi:hypothetical protein